MYCPVIFGAAVCCAEAYTILATRASRRKKLRMTISLLLNFTMNAMLGDSFVAEASGSQSLHHLAVIGFSVDGPSLVASKNLAAVTRCEPASTGFGDQRPSRRVITPVAVATGVEPVPPDRQSGILPLDSATASTLDQVILSPQIVEPALLRRSF